MTLLSKIVAKSTDRLDLITGRTRCRFESQRQAFHVFCYHSIVPDEFADRGWVASQSVTVSAFEQQIEMLAETRRVRPLGEIIKFAGMGEEIDGPHIAITFDDGLADNVMLALPILQKHGLLATFFLTTGAIDRGDLLANDKIRILRDARQRGRLRAALHPVCERLLKQPGYYKLTSLSEYASHLDELWATAQHRVDGDALECCRMMRWDEARLLRSAGMELGAHTVNHVILSREETDIRQFEIVESVRRVRAEMRRESIPFAFPNGQPSDFGDADLGVLRDLNTPYAVTTSAGLNMAGGDRLSLRRHGVGIRHRVGDLWTALGRTEPALAID